MPATEPAAPPVAPAVVASGASAELQPKTDNATSSLTALSSVIDLCFMVAFPLLAHGPVATFERDPQTHDPAALLEKPNEQATSAYVA